MKVSIVIAYYNRKKILIKTLESICKSKHDNFEMIIVDDASNEENRLEDLLEKYSFIQLIRLEPESKWYQNSCIPFNIGFKKISGDIVIIQNPECFHTVDIISYVVNHLSQEDYFSFACFSLDEDTTKNIDNYKSIIFNDKKAVYDGELAWYNHSIHRPVGYHFTSAIHRKKLEELNGFDERYSMGCNYDDVEFVHRVKKICNFKFIDEMVVLHQNHYNIKNQTKKDYTTNKNLYYNTTLKENKIKVNE